MENKRKEPLDVESNVESFHEILFKKFCSKNENVKSSSELDESKFEFVRILRLIPKQKQICLECSFNGKPAILLIEKNSFDDKLVEKIGNNFGSLIQNGHKLFRNDIYGSYLIDLMFPNVEDNRLLNQLFVSLIHPASPKDIEKYLDHSVKMIKETPELYQTITKPYIEKQIETPGHLQWLYNIIDGNAEQDRIIYSDEQFLMVKDMKWKTSSQGKLSDQEKIELYLSAIVRRRDLHSLRDINDDHIPLLKAIEEKGSKAIEDQFQIPKEHLRIFIHYQPSFYHLHVHFTHIKNEHHGFQCERAHPLQMIIENIRLIKDYYQKVTIEFPLSDASKLKF